MQEKILINEGDFGVKILFVCHGNICRSAAAEMVMKKLIREAGLEKRVLAASAAATTEEIGNDIYPPMKRVLLAHGVPCEPHAARLLTRADGKAYDLIVGMDAENLRHMRRILGADAEGKLHLLMEYADAPGSEVADPWYTRDFEKAYADVLAGCRGLLAAVAGA